MEYSRKPQGICPCCNVYSWSLGTDFYKEKYISGNRVTVRTRRKTKYLCPDCGTKWTEIQEAGLI